VKRGGTIAIVIGVCALVAAAIAFAGNAAPPRTTLEMAPVGTTMVAHVNVPALLGSPMWQAYVDDDEGMSRIERLCGHSPLEDLREADVYVVGTDESPLEQLVFLARGQLDPERLATCVGDVVRDDGGGVHEVTIEGVRAMASNRGDGRAAFLARDTVIGGDETLVRELIHLAHGTSQPVDDAALRRLYALALARRDVVIAAHVPDAWRGAIAHALADVPGVESLAGAQAIAIGASLAGGGIGLTVSVACSRESEAGRLADTVRAAIADALSSPLLRISAAGVALRRIQLEPRGADVLATLDLDRDSLEAVVALVREQLAEARAAAEASRTIEE
jgi:hypothetical protein